jgi:hypothetical protein
VKAPDDGELDAAVITLATGEQVHCRLVFRDPDPVEGHEPELWQAQHARGRGHGTCPLTAAAAALNDHSGRWRQ